MNKSGRKYTLLHEKIVWGKLADKYILIIIDEAKLPSPGIVKSIYYTRKPALDILDGLLIEKPPEKIVKQLTRKYGLSAKRAKKDFLAFLTQLKRLDLINKIAS